MAGRIEGDIYFPGAVTFAGLVPQAGAISDSHVNSGALIATSKMLHRHRAHWSDPNATTAAAMIRHFFSPRATGTLLGFRAAVHTLMSAGGGDDRTVTFDLKNAAGTSLLTAVITIDKTKAAKTWYSASLATTALTLDAYYYLEVAVAGSVGTQATGLAVEAFYDENPS